MTLRALLATLALSLTACSQGTTVLVDVTATSALSVDHLDVTAVNDANTRTFTIALSDKSIPPTHEFAIDVPKSYSGMLTVSIDAKSSSDQIVATAMGSVTLKPGATVTLSIDFDSGAPNDASAGSDGGDGGGGVDMTSEPPDLTVPCGTLNISCNGKTLVSTCSESGAQTMTTCPIDCDQTTTPPHCEQLQPTKPVTAADVYATDLTTAKTKLGPGQLVFDTTTGEIMLGAATVRPVNPTPFSTRYVDPQTGIAFRIDTTGKDSVGTTHSIAIWSFGPLEVLATATINFAGSNAVAITSSGDITLDAGSEIDLFPYDATRNSTNPVCAASSFFPGTASPSPGGSGGGNSTHFPGDGANAASDMLSGGIYYFGGGGGGGFGAGGGSGTLNPSINTSSAGGNSYGTTKLSPLFGGSGGGLNSNGSAAPGAGGGAIQIVAASSLTASGIVNAGGCGGGTYNGYSGAGGGSGGAILVEAPTFTAMPNAVFAANGGGGGSGGNSCSAIGQPGQPGTTAALGGVCSVGGNGGSGGTNGVGGTSTQPPHGAQAIAGGGGGGVGLMRFNVNTVTTTGAVFSPPYNGTYNTQGAAIGL